MNIIEQEILDKFKTLLAQRLKPAQVILFGSRARGDSDDDSDMDVVVVLDDSSPEAEAYVSECAWEAGIDYNIVICPIVYSRDEWEHGPQRYSSFVRTVRQEGIPV